VGARRMTRRAVLAGGAGGAAVVAAAASGVRPNRRWLKDAYHHSAAFSPDVTHSPSAADDAVYETTPPGVWCGRSAPLYQDVRGFVARLPRRPQVLSYGDGAHTRAYWDSVTLPAFAFLGGALRHGGTA
jgi:hypothetical protein